MRILAKAASAAACLLLGASCATVDEPRSAAASERAGQCFNANAVNAFRSAGHDAVDVEVSRNRVYRLSLGGGCFDVDWANRVALRSRSGGSFICSAGDAELIVPSISHGPDRCLVTGIRRLSDAEIQARRRN